MLVYLNDNGSIARVLIGQSNGTRSLDEAVLDLVNHRWRFAPANVEENR